MQELRQELLERAKPFYAEFLEQSPTSDDFIAGMANAHFKLANIHRMLRARDSAVPEYEMAITQYRGLADRNPGRPEYRQALAASYNWLGETLRESAGKVAEAEKAYASALELQTALTREFPVNATYQQELARTYYNRGILYSWTAEPGDVAFARAESDFREAIRLLEPLSGKSDDLQPSQDLARACNNLASLLA